MLTPQTPEIAFLKYEDLVLLEGSPLEAWNWKWPDANPSVYNNSVRSAVEADLETVKHRYASYKKFGLPPKLTAVKVNPKNGLIYFYLQPQNGDEVLDLNIVYLYQPKLKRLVCKTAVSPLQ
ncbi:MAG: hypothetical protein WDO13_11525 [Verrucomicrobiota bacterium]